MKVTYLLMANALATEENGAMSAIQLDRDVVTVQSLPHVTRRAFIARVEDFEGASELRGELVLIGPDGDRRNLALQHSATSLPLGLASPGIYFSEEADLLVEATGTYEIRFEVSSAGFETAVGSRFIHFVDDDFWNALFQSMNEEI